MRSDVADENEQQALASAVVRGLDESRRFSEVRLAHDLGADADLIVDCNITDIGRVSGTMRFLFGALAGAARVNVGVSLLQGRQVTGTAAVRGWSSSGSVFAGTTEQALQKAAVEVVQYVDDAFLGLASRRPPASET